ncbi:MAG: chromosome partitioning protein ParB, partial [Clostridiales Family XIII bacterium]|nr:chromosome partitioning protein ParB [Clostridiales Family XIII bacterium]
MAGQRKGLGKGLGALIAEAGTVVPIDGYDKGQEPSRESIRFIDIDEIKPNSSQPRVEFDEEA